MMSFTVSDGFPYYISLVKSDVKQAFFNDGNLSWLAAWKDKADYRYAPGKWSVKQIIGHMTDHERIMMYRALRFSRNDTTPLSGYDQDVLVNNSRFDELDFDYLLNDFTQVRFASISFIKGLSDEQMQRKGKAWKFELTVEEFLKATIGHEFHHMAILKERYV